MNTIRLNASVARILIVIAGLLIIISARVLVADALSYMALRTIDDKQTESFDVVPVSEMILPAYKRGISLLKKAAVWDVGNSQYQKNIADGYIRLGAWAEAMERMQEQLPEGVFAADEARSDAQQYLEQALSLEPINPDYHFALGQLFAKRGSPAWEQELLKVVDLYPVNSALRYRVALQYLILNENEKALKSVQALAKNDDSYMLENNDRTRLLMKRRSYADDLLIARSYLFRSLEIAWRASDKDPDIIMTMVPETTEAKQIAEFFLESKGNR